jgi:hypothetical protein
MKQNHASFVAKHIDKNPEDPLLALVRLLARYAAAEAVEDTKTDQHVTADTVPSDTGYLTDV